MFCSLIRLLSLSVYILNKTGTAVNKVKSLIKNHDNKIIIKIMILIMILLLFTAVPVLFNMYTNKDSNLISNLRNKYGENSVRTFRKWEIITKKMADYRNHRRFMLKCIKASITPVSCKLNPPSFTSSKSYQIIHKAEKQLLYERIRKY